MSEKLVVAVVGATGAVGKEMIKVLEQRKFPIKTLIPLASKKADKRTVRFNGKDITVKETTDAAFNSVDLTLFAGGGTASQEFAWEAVRRGSIVVDNSSTFRMRKDVPLIVPEVNLKNIQRHKGLIANPNCSTIQLVVALKPIHEKLGIKRIVVSTYQSVSGTGRDAMDELKDQSKALLAGKKYAPKIYPKQISFNCLPHIDVFMDNGYTKEEMKMIEETQKIFSDPALPITATCVRVPVFNCHAESVNIEVKKKSSVEGLRQILAKSPGIKLVDKADGTEADKFRRTYPLQLDVAGTDEVFIGRIRKDVSVENGFDMWIVADNLRKGAALNAIQIDEFLF